MSSLNRPKVLFIDQSGKPGGAELCLLDVALPYRDCCLVGLLAEGSFRLLLEQHKIPVEVFTTQAIQIRKESNFLQGLSSFSQLLPLIAKISRLSSQFDLIYANTQKALVVGAIASLLSRKPLVYHLHDILSADHFSPANQRIIVTLANRLASLVITNSNATQAAFIAAGGNPQLTEVVYNGFEPEIYKAAQAGRSDLRQQLGLENCFVVGHFSRLSPWKAQHILIDALKSCPKDVVAVLVGDALFGEQAYVAQLHQQVKQSGLEDRVRFLGFRSDVPQLMAACDLVVHTSTAPEPFGRVIVEAMLSGTPIAAAAAGGAMELVKHGKTGWLVAPGDASKLAQLINDCCQHTEERAVIAQAAQHEASQQFHINKIRQQIDRLLQQTAAINGARG
ncbi:glycosyltransferase [Phormidium tenue FACHB-886]|nr:glycosyltransferase [Phormidium tenue FACHB-886]